MRKISISLCAAAALLLAALPAPAAQALRNLAHVEGVAIGVQLRQRERGGSHD
jgi:hypothetical protein